MDLAQVKHVIEAALLGAGRPVSLDQFARLFAASSGDVARGTLRTALEELAVDYRDRGIELKEVASGYRIQIRRSMTTWLTPLWEQRAPRYSSALLETLALIAYRQPVTRGEIEQVRGVAVSTSMVRTLLERDWIRVVGHRDVPGRPALFGTTRAFLDYFGLKKLADLPPLPESGALDGEGGVLDGEGGIAGDPTGALEWSGPGPEADRPRAAPPADRNPAGAGS